jgi:hypothetical protein
MSDILSTSQLRGIDGGAVVTHSPITGKWVAIPVKWHLLLMAHAYAARKRVTSDRCVIRQVRAERDAALALAERRAGEIATLRAALTDYRDRIANITSGWGDHLPRDVMYSLSSSHYSVAALLDAALTDSKEVDNG